MCFPTHKIFVKKPRFWALHLAGRNVLWFFHLVNTKTYFSFLAAGFCPKNLAFAQKMMVLPISGGCNPTALPGSIWFHICPRLQILPVLWYAVKDFERLGLPEDILARLWLVFSRLEWWCKPSTADSGTASRYRLAVTFHINVVVVCFWCCNLTGSVIVVFNVTVKCVVFATS